MQLVAVQRVKQVDAAEQQHDAGTGCDEGGGEHVATPDYGLSLQAKDLPHSSIAILLVSRLQP